jgi:hypothetical protein
MHAGTVKALITTLGLYLAVGWIVGMVALLRSRRNPFKLLDSLGPMQSAAAAMSLWPAVLLAEWQFQQMCRRLSESPVRTDWIMTESQVPADWIRRKVVSDSAEYDWEKGRYNPTDNPGIRDLLNLMTRGDELWWFSSSDESWSHLSGRAGYVVLRNGQQVAHLTIMMN